MVERGGRDEFRRYWRELGAGSMTVRWRGRGRVELQLKGTGREGHPEKGRESCEEEFDVLG